MVNPPSPCASPPLGLLGWWRAETDKDDAAGAIRVNLPALRIGRSGPNVDLAWPLWASGFVLQTATGNLLPPVRWTNVVAPPRTNNGNLTITLPILEETTFFRLKSP